MKKIISLADIDVSRSPVVRAEYRHEVAEEYADQYRLKKNTMPLPVLFMVDKQLLIGDGLHRINAMKMAGLKQHVFEIMDGSKQDCLRYALQSNIGHGIRRTNADKWHCVKLALKEFNGLSFSVVAEYCAVSTSFVSDVHAAMESSGEIAPVEKRTGADGKARPVNPSRTTVETQKQREIDENPDTSAAPAAPPVQATGEEVKDETGYVVPDKSRPIWDRRHEVEPFLDDINSLRASIVSASESKDPLFSETNFKSVIADLANVHAQLLLARPYAVCPVCSGKLPETCKMCLGRGVVSKWRYDTSPIELRKMRGAAK
jgi:hypothetical protein